MQCFMTDYRWRGLAQCMVTFTLFPQIRLLVPLSVGYPLEFTQAEDLHNIIATHYNASYHYDDQHIYYGSQYGYNHDIG